MDLKSELVGRLARVIALVCLMIGLFDTFRLLGVSDGSHSPILMMGTSTFVYLAIFALARLFASVGLWIQANWGGALLIGVSILELGLFLIGSRDVDLSVFGFIVRLALLLAMVLVFVLAWRRHREAAQD